MLKRIGSFDICLKKTFPGLSRNILYLHAILSLLLFPQILRAAQVKLNASVDKTEATTEDAILLTVSVEGTQSAPQPVVPDTDGLNIQYSGSSSEVKIINGAMSSSLKYNFVVFPVRKGTFTLGPAYIDFEGQRINSQPITLKILAANETPQAAQPLFLKTWVSNLTPYYNEQILFTLQFGRAVEIAGANLDAPQFKDFWIENLGDQKQYRRIIGGHNFVVTEIKKALFPAKTGKLTIDPATIRCEVVYQSQQRRNRFGDHFFDDFFSNSFFNRQTKTKLLHSEPIELTVKPLPKPGQPPNFYPLVGQLTLKANLSKPAIEAGDSTTLTLDVTGNANIRDAQLIDPPHLEDFKIYDDKPDINIIPQQDMIIGQKTFKKAFVPQKAGRLKIPGFDIPYFDPKTATYKIARSPMIDLDVSPASEKEKLNEVTQPSTLFKKEAIKILGRDILPIYTETQALKDNSFTRLSYIIYISGFMLPALAFLMLFLFKLHSLKQKKDADILRRRNAYKQAMKKLSAASRLLKEGQQSKFYAEISRTLKEYLGDKFNLPGAALTPQEAESRLKASSQNGKLIECFKDLMQHCESCQFGSRSTQETECQTIYNDTKQLLKQLDKALRG
jgi:hypothetical protein